MANLKNISKEPLEVPLLSRVIQPGEQVDVSDYLLTGYAWPSATWQISGTKVVALAKTDDAYRAPEQPPADPAPTTEGE